MPEVYEIEAHRRPTFRGPCGPLTDSQALPPVNWCSACGMEVYEEDEELCSRCAKERKKEEMMERRSKLPPPCMHCTRVKNPDVCENKRCSLWRNWFLSQWSLIHSYPRRIRQSRELVETGVAVGGRKYDAPHIVEKYLKEDPCDNCECDEALCDTPCALRNMWEKQKGEAYGLEN